MRYDESLIEEVRERNDIVDVISSYVSLKKKGSSYFGLCPFHNEKSPSFSVSREKQMYYCFGCGQGGNVYTFLMEYNRMSFPEALQELAQKSGVELPQEIESPEAKKQSDARVLLKNMNKDAAVYFHCLLNSERGAKARAYLQDRGIKEETIVHFGLGYSDLYRDDLYQYLKMKGYTDQQMKDSSLVTIDSGKGSYDKFFNRVMFPIMDASQRVVGFGGRVMGDGEPKYLNSRETILFDKSHNLYGLNYAKRSRERAIILCEGYMDVISLHQAGFTNAVAPLGTAFTTGQASLLKRYTDEVILSFDSDGAGVKAALRAIPILREVGLKSKVLSMKPYKDPDELIKAKGAEEYRKRIQEAEIGRMFELLKLQEQYDQNNPEERTEFIKSVARNLLTIEEAVERTAYIQVVANRFMIGEKDLTEMVNRFGMNYQYEKVKEEYNKENQQKEKERIQKEKEHKAQKLLLTKLANKPELYSSIRDVIGPDDFFSPLLHSVALMVFTQLEDNGIIEPAKILDKFTDAEEQKEVASIFHSYLTYKVEENAENKALTDVVRKVKLASIEEQMTHTNDIAKWQELLKLKNDIMMKFHL